ncbi:DUF1629 domain-containing protein [Pedobacter sp.]|uniref:imm11 family protein n=1 Tax=Pedobacter sp. TaxID=1411316 RepID=UPI0031E049FF
MQYFSINEGLNTKEVGTYPQVEEAEYICDVWDEPRFIDRIAFSRVDFEPIVAKAILRKWAKPTDLISAGIIGFHLKLLISEKLKNILEAYRVSGMQFFRSPIIANGAELENYWVLNFHKVDMQFLDYQNSEIYVTEHVFNNLEKLDIATYEDFVKEKQKIEDKRYPYGIRIERIKLTDSISEDFFVLLDVEGGVRYVVSEVLKGEIEKNNCTGIEFMPIEYKLNEWLHNEREKIYGKS